MDMHINAMFMEHILHAQKYVTEDRAENVVTSEVTPLTPRQVGTKGSTIPRIYMKDPAFFFLFLHH